MPAQEHNFFALAFVENLSLKALASHYPQARRTPHDLSYQVEGGGAVYLYPFGAVVFQNTPDPARAVELERLHRAVPALRDAQVLTEHFSVRETGVPKVEMESGVLVLDRLTPDRAAVVALTLGQSTAMDYYERIVDQMFGDTQRVAERLERAGTMSMFTRQLHRFIGTSIATRGEVLSVLHLLDKPDAIWDDSTAEKVYESLKAEFDLTDRYQSLEMKLRTVQEALELVTDVARDRRLVWLEASIVLLIVLEIVLSFVRPH